MIHLVQKATKHDEIQEPRIPPRHEKALFLIASGKSVTEASAEAGLSRQTLSRHINQNLVVKAELARLRGEQTQNIMNRMLRSAVKAQDIIDQVLDDDSIDILDRLKASLSIFGKMSSQLDFSASHPTDPREAVAAKEDKDLIKSISSFSTSDDTVDESLMEEYRKLEDAELKDK